MELKKLSRKTIEPLRGLEMEDMKNKVTLLNVISTLRMHLDLAESNICRHSGNKDIIWHYASILHPITQNTPAIYHHDVDNNYVTNKERLVGSIS